ncbi:MAG: flagellar biosynthetic protein FliO [Deltaproteobacteria bacterium]|nr:flagellar biosynthetic protein FliO [Deltaproteobacteria bacterium]MCL5891822.1 flagellar biosynthetic protein FliO [Deltaproteobacteria bacterium]
MNKTLFIAIIVFAALAGVSYAANNNSNKNLYLKNISVSKSAGSYFIWFKFNGKGGNFIPKYVLNNYSLELTFQNTYPAVGSKFIKFKNRLFRGIELIPLKNLNLNAIIYFNKGILIDKKDIKGSSYKDYFVIKISHKFASSLFKNIGKKPVSPALLTKSPAVNINNINNAPKNMPFSLNAGSKNGGNLNVGFEVIKTVVYLALVLGLIYAIYFLLLKFKGRVAVKKNVNNLKIVSSLNLGNKKSVFLIEVGSELFLVGVSPSNIQVIGHIKDLNSDSISNEIIQTDIKDNKTGAPFMDSRLRGNDGGNIDDNSKTSFRTDGLSNKSSDNFAKVLKNQVDSKESLNLNPNIKFDPGKLDMEGNYKIKNISEARFKNKADNVFFDIEEKLKGLIENNGNIKKF